MISRNVLRSLVFGIPVLLVATVVAGLGYVISKGVGDVPGESALGIIALLGVLALAANALLLVLVLGVRELERQRLSDHDGSDQSRRAAD